MVADENRLIRISAFACILYEESVSPPDALELRSFFMYAENSLLRERVFYPVKKGRPEMRSTVLSPCGTEGEIEEVKSVSIIGVLPVDEDGLSLPDPFSESVILLRKCDCIVVDIFGNEIRKDGFQLGVKLFTRTAVRLPTEDEGRCGLKSKTRHAVQWRMMTDKTIKWLVKRVE